MNQYLITANLFQCPEDCRQPQKVLEWMRTVMEEIGISTDCCEALSYSTPEGNSGWTGFSLNQYGQFAFHHWDASDPELLQMDIVTSVDLEEARVRELVMPFWGHCELTISILDRQTMSLSHAGKRVVYGAPLVDFGKRRGTGPGQHTHYVIEFECNESNFLNSYQEVESFLGDLIKIMEMVQMTGVFTLFRGNNNKEFLAALVGITTSHLSIRKIEEKSKKYILDIFTCKDVSDEALTKLLNYLSDFGMSNKTNMLRYRRFPKIVADQVK